jgi:hypothetical protein
LWDVIPMDRSCEDTEPRPKKNRPSNNAKTNFDNCRVGNVRGNMAAGGTRG